MYALYCIGGFIVLVWLFNSVDGMMERWLAGKSEDSIGTRD